MDNKVMPVRNPDGTIKTDPHFETPRATYPDGSKGDATHAKSVKPVADPIHLTGPVFNPDGSVRSHTGGETRVPQSVLYPYGTYPGDPRNPYDARYPGVAAGPAGAVVQVDDQKLSSVAHPGTTVGPSATPVMATANPKANDPLFAQPKSVPVKPVAPVTVVPVRKP